MAIQTGIEVLLDLDIAPFIQKLQKATTQAKKLEDVVEGASDKAGGAYESKLDKAILKAQKLADSSSAIKLKHTAVATEIADEYTKKMAEASLKIIKTHASMGAAIQKTYEDLGKLGADVMAKKQIEAAKAIKAAHLESAKEVKAAYRDALNTRTQSMGAGLPGGGGAVDSVDRNGNPVPNLDGTRNKMNQSGRHMAGTGVTTSFLGVGGATIIGGMGAGAMASFAVSVAKFVEFGTVLNEIKAVSGQTTDEMERLSQTLVQVGTESKRGAIAAAEGYSELAKAGMSAQDSLTSLSATLTLATAGGIEVAKSSELMVATLNQFKLGAEDSSKVADIMATAAAASAIGIKDVALSMKYAGPIAGTASQSLRDVAVQLVAMGNAGIKGEQAGTTLRAGLTRLATLPKLAREELSKLSISIEDQKGKMLPLSQILDQLRDKYKGMTDAQKVSSATHIFGTEAVSGFLAIINTSDERMALYRQQMNDTNDVAKNMAKTMSEGLPGSIKSLNASFEALSITLGDSFAPGVKAAADGLSAFAKFATENKEISKAVISMAASFAGVTAGAITLASAIRTIPGVFLLAAESLSALTLAIGGFALTTGGLVIGIAAAAVAIGGLVLVLNRSAESLSDVYDATKKTSGELSVLTSEYEKLSAKTNKTEEDKKRLKKVMDDIAAIAPDVVTGYTLEGRAIDINIEKLKEYNKQLSDKLELQSKDVQSERIARAAGMAERRAQIDTERKDIMRDLARGGQRATLNMPPGMTGVAGIAGIVNMIRPGGFENKLDADEIKRLNERLRVLNRESGGLTTEIERLEGTIREAARNSGLAASTNRPAGPPVAPPTGGRGGAGALTVSDILLGHAAAITSPVGRIRRNDRGQTYHHQGDDRGAARGNPIYSPGEGTVAFSGRFGGFGNRAVIDYGNGRFLDFNHMDSPSSFRRGDRVAAGAVIGRVGNTGRAADGAAMAPHLHSGAASGVTLAGESVGQILNPAAIDAMIKKIAEDAGIRTKADMAEARRIAARAVTQQTKEQKEAARLTARLGRQAETQADRDARSGEAMTRQRQAYVDMLERLSDETGKAAFNISRQSKAMEDMHEQELRAKQLIVNYTENIARGMNASDAMRLASSAPREGASTGTRNGKRTSVLSTGMWGPGDERLPIQPGGDIYSINRAFDPSIRSEGGGTDMATKGSLGIKGKLNNAQWDPGTLQQQRDAVRDMANAMNDIMSSSNFGDFAQSMARAFGDPDSINRYAQGFAGIAKAAGDMKSAKNMTEFFDSFGEMFKGDSLTAAIQVGIKAAEFAMGIFTEIYDRIEFGGKGAKDAIMAAEDLINELDTSGRGIMERTFGLESLDSQVESDISAVGSALKGLFAEIDGGAPVTDRMAERIEQLTGKLDKLRVASDKLAAAKLAREFFNITNDPYNENFDPMAEINAMDVSGKAITPPGLSQGEHEKRVNDAQAALASADGPQAQAVAKRALDKAVGGMRADALNPLEIEKNQNAANQKTVNDEAAKQQQIRSKAIQDSKKLDDEIASQTSATEYQVEQRAILNKKISESTEEIARLAAIQEKNKNTEEDINKRYEERNEQLDDVLAKSQEISDNAKEYRERLKEIADDGPEQYIMEYDQAGQYKRVLKSNRLVQEEKQALWDAQARQMTAEERLLNALQQQVDLRKEMVDLTKEMNDEIEGIRNEGLAVRELSEYQDKMKRILDIQERYKSQSESIVTNYNAATTEASQAAGAKQAEMFNLQGMKNDLGRGAYDDIDNWFKVIMAQITANALPALNLPTFHSGGYVAGRMNEEIPAILKAGEYVLTPEQTKMWMKASSGDTYSDSALLGRGSVGGGVSIGQVSIILPPGTTQQHAEGVVKALSSKLSGFGPMFNSKR